MPYRKRADTAPGRRPDERRPLVPIAGLATAAVVVVSSIDAGLPANRTRAATVVVLTVLALGLWCAALLRGIRGPRLLAVALVGTGLAPPWTCCAPRDRGSCSPTWRWPVSGWDCPDARR